MVEHGNGDGNLVLQRLVLLGGGLSLDFLLDYDESGVDLVKLLEEEVLHVLGMRLDNNADVAVMLLDLTQVELPAGLDELERLLVIGLEEHIGLVGDVVGGQE